MSYIGYQEIHNTTVVNEWNALSEAIIECTRTPLSGFKKKFDHHHLGFNKKYESAL